MKLNINWQQRLSELVVVFLGVYIAFALNNWKEGKNAVEVEKKYLQGIISDLEEDAKMLEEQLDTAYYFQMASDNFITQLRYRNFEDDSATLQNVIALIAAVEFLPNTGTFNSLSATGNLSVIQDFAINKKITDLYIGQYNNLRMLEEHSRNQTYLIKIPYFHEKIRYGMGGVANKEVFYETKFMNLAYSSQYFWQAKIDLYETTLGMCKDLQATLVQYLNDKE